VHSDRRLDAAIESFLAQAAAPREEQARGLVEVLALALQGALLARHAPAAIFDAFCASRLSGGHGSLGALPPGVDVAAILARAWEQ